MSFVRAMAQDGGAYLVMQLARGESLRQRLLRAGAMPWADACELVAQMADALAAAHEAISTSVH